MRKHLQEQHMYFVVHNQRFRYFKPISEKTKPKPIPRFSAKPIALIRNVGSQPFEGKEFE